MSLVVVRILEINLLKPVDIAGECLSTFLVKIC